MPHLGTAIVTPLNDVDVLELESTVLSCVMASEQINGEWLKNGRKIKPSNKLRIKREGRRQMLLMNNLLKKDEATYAFRVGRTTTSADVTVSS